MQSKKFRNPRQDQKGLALLQTMLVITFVMMAMLITVRQSGDALREGATARKQMLIQGAVEHGVDYAIDRLQQMDPAKLATIAEAHYDIWDTTGGFVEDFVPIGTIPDYPPAGDFANSIEVRVGLRRGQRTQPPPGEDVATAFGIIVEVQVQLTAKPNVFGSSSAEERVVVALRLPHAAGGST